LPLRKIALWWLPGMHIMAGLVMCRQGPERRPPGSDRVTKCVTGPTGEYSNGTVTPGWYTERLSLSSQRHPGPRGPHPGAARRSTTSANPGLPLHAAHKQHATETPIRHLSTTWWDCDVKHLPGQDIRATRLTPTASACMSHGHRAGWWPSVRPGHCYAPLPSGPRRGVSAHDGGLDHIPPPNREDETMQDTVDQGQGNSSTSPLKRSSDF
jgi:hypothetical protein